MTPAPITIDLDAIADNFRAFAASVGVPVIPVVKADAYGHGGAKVARVLAAMGDAGPQMLAVADVAEALALRAAGIDTPLICWLQSPSIDWSVARAVPKLHFGISSLHELAMIADAAPEAAGRVDPSQAALVHLKLDTGLGRNGARECEWRALMAQAAQLERQGRIRVAGIMSHVSGTSAADDHEQLAAFNRGVSIAISTGLRPDIVHIAATAAAASHDQMYAAQPEWEVQEPGGTYRPRLAVRLGLALYGLDPLHPDTTGLTLRPALSLRSAVVGRDNNWVMELGQVDGLPARVDALVLTDDDGDRWRVGRVGSTHTTLHPIDGTELAEISCIGGASASADDWATAADTINYEITTRLVSRLRDPLTARAERSAALAAERRALASAGVLNAGQRQYRTDAVSTAPVAALNCAPRRLATIDLDLIAARLAGGTGALHPGQHARSVDDRHLGERIDISADAYGFGAHIIAPLAQAHGKQLVARTERDVAWLARQGIHAEYLPTAGRDTRVAYGFHGLLAASLTSELIQVKRVSVGQAVSYGYTWRASRPTTLGLVPLGYADAIPRSGFGRAKLFVNGHRVPIVGRIAMDQVVVDLGDMNCAAGMQVEVWGGRNGAPIDEWCAWTGQTPTAVTASLGSRVVREYRGDVRAIDAHSFGNDGGGR